MRRRILDLPRVLTIDAALALGLTPDHLRHTVDSGRWQRLARGVYLTSPDPPGRADRVQAALALAGPRSAVTGWDAVRLYRLGPATPPDERPLVLARVGAPRSVAGVWIRPTARAYRIRSMAGPVSGGAWWPVAAPGRALADTALLLRSCDAVRALVTSSVQRGWCTPADLVEELRHGPRRDSAHLRRAVDDALGGARSVAEARAADVLRAHPLPPFELNVPIIGDDGRVVAVADVLWPAMRAILEIDSREFHFSEADWARTIERHNLLTAMGYTVTHYRPSFVRDHPDRFAAEVRAWLDKRARDLDLPSR